MALIISSTAMEEKNKLSTSSVFFINLEITVPGLGDTIKVTSNGEDVTWRGETWIAFPFAIEEIGDTSKNEVPRVEVRISNVNRAIEEYLHDFDYYCKVNGFSPIQVDIFVVNSLNLASSDAEVEHTFELQQPRTDSMWVTFTLGASNPFSRRYPPTRMYQQTCRFKFKDTRCGYTGEETSCNKTLSRCRELENSTRFGGTPGIGRDGIIVI